MKYDAYNVDKIIVLGAGSSVEYGLPLWNNLHELIIKKLKTSKEYKYAKEIIEWLDMVGLDKKYKTIDECIKYMSVIYKDNGHFIENEIFKIMKDVFLELYKNNENGWIRAFNDKMLRGANIDNIYKKILFINYNYDQVLDKNIFVFDHLPEKLKLINEPNLDLLNNHYIDTLCPHGTTFEDDDFEILGSHIIKKIDTIKTRSKESDKYLSAISCYDSNKHSVNLTNIKSVDLYILGLGGGLETNINNILFRNSISNIHITNTKNTHNKDNLVKYFKEKFGVNETQIFIYDDCGDLINKCF